MRVLPGGYFGRSPQPTTSDSERPGGTKAGEAATRQRLDSVAIGRAEVRRPIPPGAAALDARRAVGICPSQTVNGSACVAAVKAILDPLAHIAVHIVEAEWVRREASDRSRVGVTVAARPRWTET